MRVCIAVVLLLALRPSARAEADCEKSPRGALPGLVRRAMVDEEVEVEHGAPEDILGWAAPAKVLTFRDVQAAKKVLGPGEAEEGHIFAVIVRPGKNGKDLVPSGILLIHMVRRVNSTVREMFAASLTGKLSSAGIFTDDVDLNDQKRVDQDSHGATKLARLGPYDPQTDIFYRRELAAVCRVGKGPSLQESVRALLKK